MSGHQISCCLVALHFLCNIPATITVGVCGCVKTCCAFFVLVAYILKGHPKLSSMATLAFIILEFEYGAATVREEK